MLFLCNKPTFVFSIAINCGNFLHQHLVFAPLWIKRTPRGRTFVLIPKAYPRKLQFELWEKPCAKQNPMRPFSILIFVQVESKAVESSLVLSCRSYLFLRKQSECQRWCRFCRRFVRTRTSSPPSRSALSDCPTWARPASFAASWKLEGSKQVRFSLSPTRILLIGKKDLVGIVLDDFFTRRLLCWFEENQPNP